MAYTTEDLRSLWNELKQEKSGDELAWAFSNKLLASEDENRLVELRRRRDLLLMSLHRDVTARDALSEAIARCEAQLLQIAMFEMAVEYPEIRAFKYSATMSYDGGEYYFDPDFSIVFSDGGDWDETDEKYWTPLREAGGLNEDALALAFESDDHWHGEISVEKIREIFADESKGVAHV